MAIEEVIDVSVAGLGSVDDLAAALEKAAKAAADVQAELGKGLDFSGAAGGAGADKLVAQYQAAFGKIADDWAKLQADMAKSAGAGGGADAAAAGLGKIADAEKAAGEQAAAMAAEVGKADDALKGAGDTSDAYAAGLGRASDAAKGLTETSAGLRDTTAGVSDGLKVQSDQTAALTALPAEHAAVMAESNAKIATGQRLNTAAARDASDDAVAAQKAQSAAATQAAADTEASAGKYH